MFPSAREISVDSNPAENQPAYQPVTLQDGNTEVHPPPAQTRGLDCVHRPKGRLPSRPNRSRIKGHSRLCSSRKYIPLQGATVRPKARTTPVHKARSVRGSLPQAAGPASVLLPGRLASGGRVPGTAVPPAALPTTDSAGPGVYSKLGEHLHRRRQAPARVWLQFLGYLASLVDVLPDCRLHMHPLQLHLLRHYHHRCLPAGMGWSLPGQYGLWGLAPNGHARSHQFVGVPSCPPLTPLLFAPATPAHSAHTHGQCHCGGLYKQAGGHSLHAVERPSGATVDVVQTRREFPYGVPYPRPGQPHSGLPVPGPSPTLRVDPPPDGHGPDGAGDQPFGGGSVRIRAQCSPPEVLLQGPGPSSLEDRRPMVGVPGLCLPADLPHSPRTGEDSGGSGVGGANSTVMAEEELVPRPDRPVSGVPEDSAPSPGLDSAADIAGPASSAERPAPDCLAIIRKASTQAGLSDRAAALVASSRRESTCESYNSRLAGFFQWCNSHGVDPRTASISQIADFLITLFDKGRLISTIRGYRSAIAAIHNDFYDGTCVSTAPCLGNLVRALFLKRPPACKLLPTWSLPAVLEALAKPPFEPLAEASLRDVTIKMVFLVAIASGQHRSALHAFSTAPGHVRWERTGVHLIPNPLYIAKNQTASSAPVEVFIQPLSAHSSITEDEMWCPVRALKFYWHRTKAERSGDQLFIITKEPFPPASRDTISKWIVAAIRAAGPTALMPGVSPRAHDTRSVSTSWALFSGVSVEEIHKVAYWRSPNSFISFYLRDIPAAEPSFSRAALAAAAQSHISLGMCLSHASLTSLCWSSIL